MFTPINEELRHSLGATAAACVVAIVGLAFEFGHAGTLPAGTVKVGELQLVNAEPIAAVTLPGIVVTAARLPVDALPRERGDETTRLAANAAAGRDAAG